MNIWAFNEPSEPSFVYESAKNGISRFGWGFINSGDLLSLKTTSWEAKNKEEQTCWSKAYFLLDIRAEDWIVHINVPSWGTCTAAKVIKEYQYEKQNNTVGDFRHMIGVDPKTVISFKRNDPNILPIIQRKLKLRGRYWRIYDQTEFIRSLENVKTNAVVLPDSISQGVYHLKNDMEGVLKNVASLIHKNHPEKKLESFIAQVLKKIPNVKEVKENGYGYKSDFGADLIVKYQTGLTDLGFDNIETLVVQVKSFEGFHWDLSAISQLKDAVNEFSADSAMLITTADKTDQIEKAIDALSIELGKPVTLIAGLDVARLVLRFYNNELLYN